jgi:RecB family endonuclease NucS
VRDKKSKDYVVIELKKGQSSDQTAGQLLRYMGWVRRNVGKRKGVQGIIIASSIDEKLRYALSEIPHVTAMIYKLNFTLERSE